MGAEKSRVGLRGSGGILIFSIVGVDSPMKTFFVLLLGVVLGVAGYWFFAEGKRKETVQQTQSEISEGAEKVREGVREAFDDIRTEDIKKELERTGRVVRQKAIKAGRAVADAADNARITATIKTKFVAEPNLSALTINVDTTDGVVTLSGSVKSHDQIARAMKIALETEGVREVISTLQIKA